MVIESSANFRTGWGVRGLRSSCSALPAGLAGSHKGLGAEEGLGEQALGVIETAGVRPCVLGRPGPAHSWECSGSEGLLDIQDSPRPISGVYTRR